MMLSTDEYPQILDINTDAPVNNVAFTTNGEHFVSGNDKGLRVWRVKDGQQAATTHVSKHGVRCVAVSRDGQWIAAGSYFLGFMCILDATTFKQVFIGKIGSSIHDIDFSPDSATNCLVFADYDLNTAVIWDIAARKKVKTLEHFGIKATKYSPQGDRIATASYQSVRVWDSNDGRLLVDVDMGGKGGSSLHWRARDLFVTTEDGTVKQIDASTGSTVSEWPLSDTDSNSCITLPYSGKLVACSAKKMINFLDMSANTQRNPIRHTDNILSISFSPDGQLLAIVASGKCVIKVVSCLGLPIGSVAAESYIAVQAPPSDVSRPISKPELDIDTAALDAWKHGRLEDADALLSAAIETPENGGNHCVLLASRALVRARSGHWDAAIVDANQSIKIQRSLLAYVAKFAALVYRGEKDEGIRVCDIAFEHFHSEHVSLLLLIKAIVLFLAGDHADAISRLNDLITDSAHTPVDPVLYVVQAYMHLLLDRHTETSDYERMIQLFEDMQIKLGNLTRQLPLVISLISGWYFDDLMIAVQQRLCEALLAADRLKEAADCVLRMVDEEIDMDDRIEAWVSDFKSRCSNKLEDLGDGAMSSERYDEAISHYTILLSLDLDIPRDLLLKRSRAYAGEGKWEGALHDACEVIKLDPLSSSGYERKYEALLGMGHHDAIDAFETMLSRMSDSSDPEIRERARHYVRPEETKEVIRTSIQNAIRDSPLVLINTSSGRLCNTSEQAAAFESTPAFTTLIMSMTAHIDQARIEQVVGEFYRYATLSHTWEANEPLYEKVIKIVVYDLEASPTHKKLRMFCKIVRDEGFNWAWSDTCCIDKGDHFILQEALVSMFKWYEGSAMTIIFLFDVDRLAELGALTRSRWNSRGWTLQEYHASKVVRIYTKDWTPYLGLTIYNHKESPEVISEMEQATGISAQSLTALRPGLREVREKLRLASSRHTTRVEDAAYSLLGIFSMTLPATYGEGDKALGRLLSQILTSSGDMSILAWTGRPGSFNSCLPTNIIVFSQPLTFHIPPAIPDAEITAITDSLHVSSPDLGLVARLYDELNALPLPSFLVRRMKLPCLAFKIRSVTRLQDGSDVVFRAHAGVLGVLEIKTTQNIARAESLYLVHPWTDFLLDRHAATDIDTSPHEDRTFDFDESPPSPDTASTLDTDFLDATESLVSPTVPVMHGHMEFLARLRQPFGALLLAPTRRNVAEFRRIASENVITAEVQEITSATLNRLIESVRVLDVL